MWAMRKLTVRRDNTICNMDCAVPLNNANSYRQYTQYQLNSMFHKATHKEEVDEEAPYCHLWDSVVHACILVQTETNKQHFVTQLHDLD